MTRSSQSGPDFLIVGTPRSGTTLVQRLAAELPGVRVAPETHFFPLFMESRLSRASFPLRGVALRQALGAYTGLHTSVGLGIDEDRVLERLGGACDSPWALFSAIVDELAGGDGRVGEKTPNHLRWWRPLTRDVPELRLITVVRDPRGVIASHQNVPFGMKRPLLLALQWREDIRDLDAARRNLSSARLLELRYEEVVDDPPRTQRSMADFLGVPFEPVPIDQHAAANLFPAWEQGWKGRAAGPIERSRADAWRSQLDRATVRRVEAAIGTTMRREGYPIDPAEGSGWLSDPQGITARDALRTVRFRIARRRSRARIARIRVR